MESCRVFYPGGFSHIVQGRVVLWYRKAGAQLQTEEGRDSMAHETHHHTSSQLSMCNLSLALICVHVDSELF